MSKQIDLKASVYEICTAYPEILDIMYEAGFKEIKVPGMLTTAGRFMTIPKGAVLKKLDINDIKVKIREKGFIIIE